jgi:hypothetical protein
MEVLRGHPRVRPECDPAYLADCSGEFLATEDVQQVRAEPHGFVELARFAQRE